MNPFVKCSRCKELIYIREKTERLTVNSDGGFLCDLCIELEKDLLDSLSKILVRHAVARVLKKMTKSDEMRGA